MNENRNTRRFPKKLLLSILAIILVISVSVCITLAFLSATSGNAKNVAMAVKAARALGLATVGMTGCGGGALESLCDVTLKSREKETYLVQEEHLMFYHRLCLRVEDALFAE